MSFQPYFSIKTIPSWPVVNVLACSPTHTHSSNYVHSFCLNQVSPINTTIYHCLKERRRFDVRWFLVPGIEVRGWCFQRVPSLVAFLWNTPEQRVRGNEKLSSRDFGGRVWTKLWINSIETFTAEEYSMNSRLKNAEIKEDEERPSRGLNDTKETGMSWRRLTKNEKKERGR